MIEELVNNLAELQTERATRQIAADEKSAAVDKLAEETLASLANLEEERRTLRLPDAIAIEKLNAEIEEIKARIIDAWSGKKKTMSFDTGTLKFRTTQSLVIENETLVLTGLLDHTSTDDVATNYITGFKKTAVKKYMSVLPLPVGAARIDSKTTVKMEQKE